MKVTSGDSNVTNGDFDVTGGNFEAAIGNIPVTSGYIEPACARDAVFLARPGRARDDRGMVMIAGVLVVLGLIVGSDVVELVISRKSLRPPKVWT